MDALRRKPQVQQRHAFTGCGEQWPFLGIRERLEAKRIAGDEHIAASVHERQAIGPIEPLADIAHHLDQ
jgi:hypothetical protein